MASTLDSNSPQDPIERWEANSPLYRIWLARAGLQGKLIVGFLVLLFIALGVSSWVFVAKSRITLSDIMGEQATQLSISLALASKSPLSHNDVAELDRMGRDLLKSRNIVFVTFSGPDGRPLAIACRDPEFHWNDFNLHPLLNHNTQQLMQVQRGNSPVLGDYLQVVAPVLGVPEKRDDATDTHPRLLGYVAVGMSQTREQAQLRQVSYLGLTLGCLIFIASLPVAAGLVHRILLPIRQLVKAVNELASGNLDAKVAIHRPDEIGTLARSFNDMAIKVKQQQEQLIDANRDLEETVEKRTAELRASNDRLSSEIAEKEDFLRAVSHDLNAPLRNIGGMATMMLMKYKDKFDEDVIRRLERINKNVEVETDLIAELLELSRIKTRRHKIEPVDAHVLANDLVGVFDDDLRKHGITLIVDNRLPILTCEKARLRQVFQNLIDNAIKYMGEGPTREIHIGCDLSPIEATFYCRDTGMGIDSEDLPKVFFVFRRGKNSSVNNVAGKGVGLASVKSIIETYDGRIWVESEVKKGTTFHFAIPARYVPALCSQGASEAVPVHVELPGDAAEPAFANESNEE